jgi:hypothetical protein
MDKKLAHAIFLFFLSLPVTSYKRIMFNQKPAFKFVIKSKIDDQEATPTTPPKQAESTTKEEAPTANPLLLDDKKRKRADKDHHGTGNKVT